MGKRISIIICALTITLGSALTCTAAGFQSIGYNAISMGGAGVAYTSGSYAAYYNPALLASHKYGMEINISPGVGFREHNLADHIDTLADIGIEETMNNLSSLNFPGIETAASGSEITTSQEYTTLRENLSTIQTELGAMSGSNGLEVAPGVTVGVQVRNLGFGIYGLSDVAASAIIDPQRLDIVVPVESGYGQHYVQYDPAADTFTVRDEEYYEGNSLEYAVQEQTTTIHVIGLTYLEIPVAYAHKFETSFGDLSVGGAFKIMSGNTYKMYRPVDTESGDISDDIDDYEKKSTAFGVDAGVLYNPPVLNNLSLGMVMKNINTPKFDVIDGSELEFKPMARFGAAYSAILDRLTFAMDMDLTENDGYIPGYKERYMGGGVDFHPFSWLSVRAGLMKNIAESDEGTMMTAGFGFGSKWFQFDVAGQYSTDEGHYKGDDYPRSGRVQVSLVSKWF
ncbi:MAG: conjugal transfer protein TraF [Deltaproteobacteria bacterium]|nr:conjugal transfer protein TraF [Deltaproteobacteria bacterium]